MAIVTTVGWIYRGRTASLAAIEARLDEPEMELRTSEPGAQAKKE